MIPAQRQFFDIDKAVRQYITRLEGVSRPDESRAGTPFGSPGKAPDYFLKKARLAIEQKSLNPTKDIIEVVNEIAEAQGHARYRVYGTISISEIIKELPNPAAANRKIHSRLTNKLGERLKEAARQLGSWCSENKIRCIRMVIIVDHTTLISNGRSEEYEIARPPPK